jgi:hypothetical protein
MSHSTLIRWSGMAAVVGAEFVLIGGQPESVAAGTSALIIVRVAFVAVIVLALLGLVGLYASQPEETGTLGLIGFLVAFIGTVMTAGLLWSAAFVGPWLAEAAPELLDTEPAGLFAAGFMLSLVLLALGWLLFGLASLQARVLPRGAAILLMVGSVLFFVIFLLEVPGSSVVFGAALAWMGYTLWSGDGEPAASSHPAM